MQTSNPLGRKLLVGIPIVDIEHQALLNELDRLVVDPACCVSSAHFSEVGSRIGMQLLSHFQHEESILRDCGMPAAKVAEHIRAHQHILEQFTTLQFDLMSGTVIDRAATVDMIKSWIVAHLEDYDLCMRPYALMAFSDRNAEPSATA